MPSLLLRKNISPRIAEGHPWIYNNEVEKLDGGVEDGAIVDVLTGRGKFLGKAYYNSRSQIVARKRKR